MSNPATIKFLRLVTGEELISKVFDDKENNVLVLTLPHIVMMQPNQNGSVSVAIIPWMSHIEEFKTGIEIQNKDVMFQGTPMPQMTTEYQSRTGSILTPKSSLLLP